MITLLLVGLVFAYVSPGRVLQSLKLLHWQTILLVLALSTFFNIFIYADRWRLALKAIGIRIPLKEIALVHAGTGPYRLLFPIQTGELVSALVLAQRNQAKVGHVLGTVLYNKYLTLMATLILLAAAVLIDFPTEASTLKWTAGFGIAVLLGFASLEIRAVRNLLVRGATRLNLSLGEFTPRLLAAFEQMPARSKIGLLLYTLFFQFSEVVVCYFLFRDLGIHLPFARLVAYVQLMILISSLPISIAGVGPREHSAFLLLAAAASAEAAVAAGFAFSFFEYLWPMILGLPLTGVLGVGVIRKWLGEKKE